jgi:hypothetical protein
MTVGTYPLPFVGEILHSAGRWIRLFGLERNIQSANRLFEQFWGILAGKSSGKTYESKLFKPTWINKNNEKGLTGPFYATRPN